MTTPGYFIKLLSLTVALIIAIFIVDKSGIELPKMVYAIVPAFAVLTLMMHRMTLRANQTSPQMFLTAFMASVTIKLLLVLAFLTIYLLKIKVSAKEVGISLFVIYMSYTILEVIVMQTYLRKPSKK